MRADLSSSNGSYGMDQDLNTTSSEVLRSSSATYFYLRKVKTVQKIIYFVAFVCEKLVLNWNNLVMERIIGKFFEKCRIE